MKLNWKRSNLKRALSQGLVACGLIGVASVGFAAKDKEAIKGQQARIIGGVEAEVGAWPFMTALISASGSAVNGQFCGASYIGQNYVLTASHCVDGTSAESINVVIGIHNLNNESTEGERIAVSEIIMHESYSGSSLDNDVAILVLESEPENAQPVNLISPAQMAELSAGDTMTVMGWGNRSTTSSDFPDILHQVDVALYDQQQCNIDYSTGITDTMVCAGFAEGGRDSCQGDSGGPMVVQINEQWYQTGVVSWGEGCAQPNRPGVYARVSYFDSWFASKLSGITASQSQSLDIVELGFASELEFTLNNGPSAPLNVGTVSISQVANMPQPNVVSDSCTGATLAVEASCSVLISVVADTAGIASFAISYPTDNVDVGSITDTISFNVIPETTFDAAAALDMTGLKWFTPATLGWQSQSTSTTSGESALQSPDELADNQSSMLMTVIEGPRTLSFDYRVSSEANYDFFQVRVNGELVLSESGNMTEFVTQQLTLEEGTQRITFNYIKDYSVSSFDDKAYIDNVVVSNESPVVTLTVSDESVDAGENVVLDASGTSDPDGDSYSLEWTQTAGPTVNLMDNLDGRMGFVAPDLSTTTVLTFSVTATDQFGAVASSSVSITVNANDTDPGNGGGDGDSGGSSGGGSMAWFALALLSLARLRRQR